MIVRWGKPLRLRTAMVLSLINGEKDFLSKDGYRLSIVLDSIWISILPEIVVSKKKNLGM